MEDSMSQDSIVKLLMKKKEPLTSKEISELLEIRQETIIKALNKLLKYHEVNCRKITVEEREERGYTKCKGFSRFKVFWIDLE
jgi:transcription initiation factor IIE alpha subunit